MEQQTNGAQQVTSDQALKDALERLRQHQAAGRLDDAGELLESLMTEHPGNPMLMHCKALIVMQRGNVDQGRALMEEALAKAPDNPVQLADYGVLLAQSGDMDKAIEQFQMVVDIAPNFANGRGNLGAAQVAKMKYAEAIPNLREAIKLDPQLLDAHTNLGMAYLQTDNLDAAIDVLFKALAIDPLSVTAHTQISGALYRRERHDAAEHHARRAVELAPNAPVAYLHLGNALASSGKMQEAAEALLKMAGRARGGLPALSRLVHLRKTQAGSPELKILEAHLGRLDSFEDEQKATLQYAAGKAYDDLGDYARAFEHFRQANAINKTLHGFDLEALLGRSERLLEFCSPALLQRFKGAGVKDVAPIFICGMPRSGTTLMDQMFSRHPKVQAGGELRAGIAALHRNTRLRQALGDDADAPEIVADDFKQLGEAYVASVRQEGIRSEYVSDKMPANYRNIGLLALALPRAKFLIMRRHPLDCLLSNYIQHFGRNQPFSSDFKNLAGVYAEFDKMTKAWVARLPDQVREVSYEAVTQDAEGQMRSILEFVGLEWDAEVLDHKASSRQVNTASLAQIREPIYTRSVERWRNYGKVLAPLASELRAFLTEEELQACGVD